MFRDEFRIIVTGSRGMLGQDLMPRLEKAGYDAKGLSRSELDITKSDIILPRLRELDPGLVINCAAYTAVDQAEKEPDLAFSVNRDGPAHLADACRKLSIPIIHISTDYVFDGQAKRGYRENDQANPLGVYGCSKWEGEEAVRYRLKEHLIVRTSWLYGVHGNNFVKTILRLAREKEELRVVSDQYGCPTWTGQLSGALVTLAGRIYEDRNRTPWGAYHFCSRGSTTWYDFAQAILNEAWQREPSPKASIIPIGTPDYPTPAKRPMWSVLDCNKIREAFHVSPKSWQKGLISMFDEFYDNRGGRSSRSCNGVKD